MKFKDIEEGELFEQDGCIMRKVLDDCAAVVYGLEEVARLNVSVEEEVKKTSC